MIRQQMRKLARTAIMFGLGLVLFSMIFMRTPNAFYQEVNGNLVPIDPHSVSVGQLGPYANQSPYGNPGPYGAPPGYGYQGSPPNPRYPQQGYSNQSYPSQGYQNQGYPNQGYPNQGYTQYSAPPQGSSPYNDVTGYRPPSSYPTNAQEAAYNPRMQSNYRNPNTSTDL